MPPDSFPGPSAAVCVQSVQVTAAAAIVPPATAVVPGAVARRSVLVTVMCGELLVDIPPQIIPGTARDVGGS